MLLVSVVDDNESMRESLPDLLRDLGFAARGFASAKEFLASDSIGEPRCLILDIAIFITARADESVRPVLLAQGAVDCLFKPFSEQDLRSALGAALRSGWQ